MGKICPVQRTHRSHDAAHAQWLQMDCQWYPMGDVRTHNSRTDSCRIFKLGGGIDHMTRHVCQKVKVTRSRNVLALSSNNAIISQQVVVSTLNLVETFIAIGEICAALSTSVG